MLDLFKKKQSTTLFFVSVSWAVLVAKFAISGIQVTYQGQTFSAQPMSAGEFGAAVLAILAIWLQREYTEKVSKPAAGGQS